MVAIETSALTKRFGDLTAVDGLDLAVESGEVYGFLGPNGAGKSTTINVLLGFTPPSDGSATVLGHDVVSESRELRAHIGVLPEGFTVYDRLTAREHVEYAGELAGVTPETETLLDRVGLQREAWERQAGGFSKGMCQRLALGCALVGDPDLLILDEPSSGLDPQGMAEIREIITDEADAGTTVFFSSHILGEVEAVCDRVGILVDGSLAATGTIDDLRAGTNVRAPVEFTLETVPDGLEDEIGSMAAVESIALDDGTLRVEVAAATDKIDVIRAVADRATVLDVVAEEASLEAVFERYANGVTADGSGDEGAEPGDEAGVTAASTEAPR